MFAGGVHLGLADQHHGAATWHTWSFLGDGLAFFGVAAWLVFRAGRLAWQATGIVAGLTVLAYVASRTIGLPGHPVEPWDPNGLATSGLEMLVALGALVAIRGRAVAPIRRVTIPRSRPERTAAVPTQATARHSATAGALLSRPLPGTMRQASDVSIGSFASRLPRT
jgi:hypothetical protein